jgi:hypothetical protein
MVFSGAVARCQVAADLPHWLFMSSLGIAGTGDHW